MSFNVNQLSKSRTIPKLNHTCGSDPHTPQIIGVISLSFIMAPTLSFKIIPISWLAYDSS